MHTSQKENKSANPLTEKFRIKKFLINVAFSKKMYIDWRIKPRLNI